MRVPGCLGQATARGSAGNVIPLSHLLDAATATHVFTYALTANEVADHIFGHQANRFRVFRPFQLLLAGRQMVEGVPKPQDIRVALAHLRFHLG